jgi:hypothetical protein
VTIKLIVPDLDAETLNADELDEFVQQIGRLAEYAKNKAMAIRCRRAGDVRTGAAGREPLRRGL